MSQRSVTSWGGRDVPHVLESRGRGMIPTLRGLAGGKTYGCSNINWLYKRSQYVVTVLPGVVLWSCWCYPVSPTTRDPDHERPSVPRRGRVPPGSSPFSPRGGSVGR